jgi:CO dehydrogenase nickel-insertion accessory protein CooC1
VRALLVTVAGPRGRRDLSLPADAPVAELLPVLARLLGDGTAPEGWTLTPTGGRPLPAGSSLAAAGILNGALLHLEAPRSAPAAPPPPPAPPPPNDGRTPVERTAAALPQRHPLPERASLAAQALLASPTEARPPTTSGPPRPPRFKGGLVLALLAATEAASGRRGAAPLGAAAFAPVELAPDPAAPRHRATPSGSDHLEPAPLAGPSSVPGPALGRDPASWREPAPGPAVGPGDATWYEPAPGPWGGGPPGRAGLGRLRSARWAWRSSSYQEALDAAVGAPLPGRAVVVAVAAARDGVGATTVTGLLGTLLALHRRERVLAVDAGGSDHPGSLARVLGIGWELGARETAERLAGDRAAGADDLLARLARAAQVEDGPERRPAWLADDLVARLARAMPTKAGLDARLGRAAHGLALLPAPAQRASLDERAWQVALERLRSLYPLVLVDCGAGLEEPAGRAAVRACDQLLLVTDADPVGASLAVEAGLPLIRTGLPVTVVVNRVPAGDGRASSPHWPAEASRPRTSLDLDRLGGYLPEARGLVTVPSAPRAAAELAAGTFAWPSAGAGCRRAVHELAASLVADLAERPGSAARR